MGTFVVQELLGEVAKKLFDETNVRWDPDEQLRDYNTIHKTVVGFKPDAGAQTAPFALVAGSKQDLPANASQFRRLTRNLGADGLTPGRNIRIADRDDLDHSRPDWHIESGVLVKHFIADKQNPLIFYTYPNVAVPWFVELVYCGTFDDSAAPTTDMFCLPDVYRECVFFGMMARARAKNFKAGDMQAVTYWQTRFNEFLGLKGQSQFQFTASSAMDEQRNEAAGEP